MLSVGVDIIEISRIARAIDRWGERFLSRIYRESELAFCRGKIGELAVRFAAKEAISKALGTGIMGIDWKEMEILPDPRGKPLVTLYGKALQRARTLGLTEWAISLSHSDENAIAFVVAMGGQSPHHKERKETGRL
ncbi:MAG: holo-ACP synthase [Anaerolineae bacterium]|nr:holo-ACP synthase [Anaerolineae bacterium]